MKTTLTTIALSIAALTAQAQQTTTITGDGGRSEQQNIGDTTTNQNDINSTSTQLGNSANANGARIDTNVDTRDQNTVSSAGGSATGGSATGNLSNNDNRSAVGNTSSNSGGNNLADTNNNQSSATTGPSSATTGASTSSTGPVTSANANTAQGGSASGTNLSANRNTNAGGAGGSASAGGGAGGQGGTSSAQGGTSGATAQGGAGAAGNSTTRVDASDRSTTNYSSRATVLPPTVHGAAAPPLAVGHMAVVSTPCGPRVGIVRRDIVGKRFGVWGGQDDVLQGQDEIAAPAAQPFVVVDGYLLGHIVTTYTTTVGTSSAGSFSVGGYGKSGEGAQGGGAASGQLQQIVQRVTIRECVMAQAAIAPREAVQVQREPVAPVQPARQDRN